MPLFSFKTSKKAQPKTEAALSEVKWAPYDQELRQRETEKGSWSKRDKALASQTQMLDYAVEGAKYPKIREHRKKGLCAATSDGCMDERLVLEIADVDVGGGEVIHTLRAHIVTGSSPTHVVTPATPATPAPSTPGPKPGKTPTTTTTTATTIGFSNIDVDLTSPASSHPFGLGDSVSLPSFAKQSTEVTVDKEVSSEGSLVQSVNAREAAIERDIVAGNATRAVPTLRLSIPSCDDQNQSSGQSSDSTFGPDSDSSGLEPLPSVFIHGMFGGLALWALSIRDIVESTPSKLVYFIDIPGYGRSSRANLPMPDSCEQGEEYFLTRINCWREQVGISKMNLFGHSLGGYLSSCYALKYPSTVNQLVLCDPWGVEGPGAPEYPWYLNVWETVAKRYGPMFVLRASGPFAPCLIGRARNDLVEKWGRFFEGTEAQEYMNYCNTQSPATGERQAMALQIPFARARKPLCDRLAALSRDIDVHFVYGDETWLNISAGQELAASIPHRTTFHIVPQAGHQLYLDNHSSFNDIVRSITNGDPESQPTCIQSKALGKTLSTEIEFTNITKAPSRGPAWNGP